MMSRRSSANSRGSVEKTSYSPLDLFGNIEQGDPLNQIYGTGHRWTTRRCVPRFPLPQRGPDPRVETLSISLTCTNGQLPEKLQFGDISVETSDSPALLTFQNVIPPTFYTEPPQGRNVLWKFLSHLSINFLSVATTDNRRELMLNTSRRDGTGPGYRRA
jgi:type VI secretion system protein ImpG